MSRQGYANIGGYIPHLPQKGKYFCRLCRESGIRERKAHLKNYHRTDKKCLDRPSSDSIIKEIFIESK